MKILIDIPKAFEVDYNTDRFAEFFQRCLADMGTCCGNYEFETAEMMEKAFAESKIYDPEKVVEQLEKAKEKDTEIALDEAQKERCFWYAQGMNRAIEIVKGECATEQSCEWKLEDLESNLYVTGCENRQLIFEGTPEENGYKYCPYCGRKIKRGGIDG